MDLLAEITELKLELELERRRADICDAAALSAIARANGERDAIVEECLRRADGMRAAQASAAWPAAEGAALALERLAEWIEARKQ